jgi:hypothetical protein
MVMVVRTHQSILAMHHDAPQRGLSRRARGDDRGEKYLDVLGRALLCF